MKGDKLMSKDFQEFLQEQLKDPKFAKEYYAIKSEVEFSIMLYDARKKSGMTQKELAEKCGVKQENISRIENGDRMPSLNTIQKIANALGLQLALIPMK